MSGKRAAGEKPLIPRPRKGLDWDDEDLTTRVFDRPDDLSGPLADAALRAFDADHTSRITLEQLETLRAQLTSEEDHPIEHPTSIAPSQPVACAAPGSRDSRGAVTKGRFSALAGFPHGQGSRWLGARLRHLTLVGALGTLGCVALFSLAVRGALHPTESVDPTTAASAAQLEAAGEKRQGANRQAGVLALAAQSAGNLGVKGVPGPRSSLTGSLHIQTRPWAKIYVDGSPLGISPQTQLELVAGPHEIMLVNEALGLRKTLRVHIAPGARENRLVEL